MQVLISEQDSSCGKNYDARFPLINGPLALDLGGRRRHSNLVIRQL